MKKSPVRTADVMRLLVEKYSQPAGAWALLPEVPSSVGFAARRADALAVSCWSSLGLEVVGFEVKVSRSDWMKEMKDPAKSLPVSRYCHRWWIVAGSSEIVKPAELPRTWGLMVVTGEQLKVIVPAPLLQPEPLTYEFVAGLFREMKKHYVSRDEVMALEARHAAEISQLRQRLESERALGRDSASVESQRKALLAFENAAGKPLTEWSAETFGRYVRLCEAHDGAARFLKDALESFDWSMKSLNSRMDTIKKHLTETLDAMRTAIHSESTAVKDAGLLDLATVVRGDSSAKKDEVF